MIRMRLLILQYIINNSHKKGTIVSVQGILDTNEKLNATGMLLAEK